MEDSQHKTHPHSYKHATHWPINIHHLHVQNHTNKHNLAFPGTPGTTKPKYTQDFTYIYTTESILLSIQNMATCQDSPRFKFTKLCLQAETITLQIKP